MNYKRIASGTAIAAAFLFIGNMVCARATAVASGTQNQAAIPSIEQFVVPPTLHHLQATVEHTMANMSVLSKIGPGFADGYRVDRADYIYTAPDTLEMQAHAGILSATQIYTNTTRQTDFGFIHRTDDISKDVTKRQTIEVLGLLPQNYLDIMRSDYLGQETVKGVPCDIFMLRYITDRPNDNRRFETWVSIAQHYIVKQRVWDGGDHEHQTVFYSDPIQAVPGVWIPTRVEVYDPQGELGGIAVQKNISAS